MIFGQVMPIFKVNPDPDPHFRFLCEHGARYLTRFQTMYNVLKFSKNDEIMSKKRFTGTATQPQCNRKFCQFNKDQYCTYQRHK